MNRVLIMMLAALFAVNEGCGSGGAGGSRSAPVLWGVAYGPYRTNQTPNSGPQPTADQMRTDMSRLAVLGGRIRTYTVTGDQAQIPSLARAYGLKTWAGAWIGSDLVQNDTEIQRLISVSVQPGVETVIIGNEALLRGDVTPAQLVSYIRQVKSRVQVPVAYADTWSILEQHPEIVQEVDIALAHVHPYWDNIAAEDGANYVLTRFQSLQALYPGKQIVIGETGWPSAGSTRGHSIAGEAQQQVFYSRLLDTLKQHSEMRSFAFEAFDEPFKIQEADVGPHWGIFKQDGSTKSQLVPLIPSEPADSTR